MSIAKRAYELLNAFGAKVTIAKLLQAATHNVPVLKYITGKIKYKAIVNWLFNENKDLIDNFNKNHNTCGTNTIGEATNIWVLWWQGFSDAPEIIKICINSIKKNSNGRKVITLDKNNYFEYVNIPQKYIDLMEQKIISLTQFSDLLRLNLLYQQGGIWLDATYYLTQPLNKDISNMKYFTIRHEKAKEVPMSKGLWTSSCLAFGQQNNVLSLILNIYERYFSKRTIMIDYLLTDYIFATCCDHSPIVNEMFRSVPVNNKGVDELLLHLNTYYCYKLMDNMTKETSMHKLSWKFKYNSTKNSKLTVYGYIQKLYQEEIDGYSIYNP